MFKHAYVRGIQTALVNSDHAKFPDEGTAHKVADYIADHSEIDLEKGVSNEIDQKIASQVLEASEWFKRQPNFKAAGWNKLSSWEEVRQLADRSAEQLMVKAAEGSTIEGGDKGNEEGQSPAGETKMDSSQRPPGYAEDSRGKTEVDTRPGAVGKEETQPNAPKETDHKENSPNDQTKSSSLRALFQKAAEGSTIQGGDKGNKEMSSAEAKMDASQRPVGYAVLPTQGALGQMMAQAKGPAIVGRETPQPNKPAETPSGSNSVIQHSAKAASEDPYITLFKKVAAEINEYLPIDMAEDAKIASVRMCMGLTTEEKYHYLTGLQKEAAERVASEPATVPPGSRSDGYKQHSPEATHSRPGAYDGRGGNQGTKTAEGFPPFMKKDEEKKDGDGDKKDDGEKKDLPPFMQKKDDDGDKKDDDKKEASLRDMFRRATAAQQAATP
jgi:hypothetical protein